jgi:peptide deformylase
MKTLPQPIFSEFTDKVISSSYQPADPLEVLKGRLTATSLLQHADPAVVAAAEAFIQRTSTFKEADLARLQAFASQIKTWDAFEICSAYTNSRGIFLEYKLSFTTGDNSKQTRHFHAQYEMRDNLYYFLSQTPPLIRVIGDPILHKPGIPFPQDPTPAERQELERQIEHAKSVLIQTSGAGIAANQCAAIENPYCFTIVGVFYDIPEHVSGVARRYPTAKFPPATIMVNPVITATSQARQSFNHACLSVPCSNRCAVLSPQAMSANYQDPLDGMRTKQVSSTAVDAVVLWHELSHILFGKTYMDVTFESLPAEDLVLFHQILNHEIQRRQAEDYSDIPELTVPPFYFSVKIDDEGMPKLAVGELCAVLPQITDETLAGLAHQANVLLKKSRSDASSSPGTSSQALFTGVMAGKGAVDMEALYTLSGR